MTTAKIVAIVAIFAYFFIEFIDDLNIAATIFISVFYTFLIYVALELIISFLGFFRHFGG